MASFDETSQLFLAWLSSSQAIISPKILLQDQRQKHAGRGVVATEDIQEDELLFRIPRSAILSVENSILSKEIPQATFDHLGPWLSLILVMLYEYENKEASSWAPYFDVLPAEFNTLMFWERDELEQLQASGVRNKIGKEEADETFKTELIPIIREFAEIFFSGDMHAQEKAEAMNEAQNLQLMHKMGSLIMAYAFDVEPANPNKVFDEEGYASEDEDEALPKGMVPMADMLNADADNNNARLFYEEESLSMKALKPIRAGQEIFNDYGPLPRSDLLRRYGYITDNYAQYDVVEISLDLIIRTINGITGSSLDDRLEYLDKQDLLETGYDITASDPFTIQESVSPELIILVETLLLPDLDFETLKRNGQVPTSRHLDAGVAKATLSIVQAHAALYATSLEDDLQGSTPLPSTTGYASKERRYAMAKSVRIGEKMILQQVQEALTQWLREVVNPNGGSKRTADDARGSDSKRKRVL